MQEARFVVQEIAPNANRYNHHLMDYNNDPTITFADIQGVFWLLEEHLVMRLAIRSLRREPLPRRGGDEGRPANRQLGP